MAVTILIPYNFTRNDEKAIDFVGQRYADHKDVSITLFHAFTPVTEIDDPNNPIMKKVIRNTAYLRCQQEDQKEALNLARNKLMNHGFAEHHIKCLFMPAKQDIADSIIALCKTDKIDVVVLNRNPWNIINYFSRSISKKVVRKLGKKIRVHIVD